MDVEATLARLREMTEQNRNAVFSHESLELFDALDGWLSRGGFLPSAWDWPRPTPDSR
jgi:hypothetical protein